MAQGTGTNRPKTYTHQTSQPHHIHNTSTRHHTPPPKHTTPPPRGAPQKVNKVTAAIAAGKRPDPSRTRKLSLPAPMILPNPGGKVGHRRTHIRITPHNCVGGDSIFAVIRSIKFLQLSRTGKIEVIERHTWSRTGRAAATGARPRRSAPRTSGPRARSPRAQPKPDGDSAAARKVRRFPPTSKPSNWRPKSAANSRLWIAATADVRGTASGRRRRTPRRGPRGRAGARPGRPRPLRPHRRGPRGRRHRGLPLRRLGAGAGRTARRPPDGQQVAAACR